MMGKLIIFREFDRLKVTTEENHAAHIRDERKVTDCGAFNSPSEIVDYYCKWFGTKPDDFITDASCDIA